jgi:hypothetical protein
MSESIELAEHRVMISGSRGWPNPLFVQLLVRLIKESGAKELLVGFDPKKRLPKGVDLMAYDEAVKVGLPVRTFVPVWVVNNRVDRSAGLVRNIRMAEEATRVMACWDEESSGTAQAIVVAHQMGKLFRIYGITKDKSPEDLLRLAYKIRKVKFPEPVSDPTPIQSGS